MVRDDRILLENYFWLNFNFNFFFDLLTSYRWENSSIFKSLKRGPEQNTVLQSVQKIPRNIQFEIKNKNLNSNKILTSDVSDVY